MKLFITGIGLIALLFGVTVKFPGCGKRKPRNAGGYKPPTAPPAHSTTVQIITPPPLVEIAPPPPPRPEVDECTFWYSPDSLPRFYNSIVLVRISRYDDLAPVVPILVESDFNDRVNAFQSTCPSWRGVYLTLNRTKMALDAFCEVRKQTVGNLKSFLPRVTFVGETGDDAGGLTKEMFTIVPQQLLHPVMQLFEATNAEGGERYFFQGEATELNLKWCAFVGRLTAMALKAQSLLRIRFPDFLYKLILEVSDLHFDDLKTFDREEYNVLRRMVGFSDEELAASDLVFSEELDGNEVNLITDGNNIPVTRANVKEYVVERAKFKMITRHQSQLEAFLTGFNQLFDRSQLQLLRELNYVELKQLLMGSETINVAKLRRIASSRWYGVSQQTFDVFWDAFESMNNEERKDTFRFITAMDAMPTGTVHIQLNRYYVPASHLPKAHTCFNSIDVPPYTDVNVAKVKILQAARYNVGIFEREPVTV